MGKRIEAWLDGGITTGQDVLKAVALGARGTMIGRAGDSRGSSFVAVLAIFAALTHAREHEE